MGISLVAENYWHLSWSLLSGITLLLNTHKLRDAFFFFLHAWTLIRKLISCELIIIKIIIIITK
jgi:hypothetical protein